MASSRLIAGDFGEEIARLHERLATHGLEVSSEERKRTFFGPSTREAVSEFQKTHGIDPSCEVCGKTAALLAGPPVTAAAATPVEKLTPTSTVFAGMGTPTLLEELDPFERLRTIGTDLPTIQPNPVVEGMAANSAVPGSPPVARNGEPLEQRDTSPYTVVGTVACPDRAGVGGLRVQIVDKNIGQDVPLAEGVTDERGRYSTRFVASAQHKPWKANLDLQAHAFSGQTFLAASDVRYNATNQETLNILLLANCDALPSEHETLTRALATCYGGRLSDLKESDDRQDITYLANKTGWDARAVALAALADQFSARTVGGAGAPAIAPPFFYALFRAGLPANEDTLYHTDAKTLEGVWKKSTEQGVIPKDSADQISNLIVRFQALSAQKLLTGPALVGASSLKEMLTASRLDDAQQKQFAELYAAHRADMPKFWEAATNAFGENTAHRLQVDGKLGFLTINNAPLMQELHNTVGDNGLTDPLQLAQQGYHRAQKWTTLLAQNVPVPKEIPGDTPEAKQANYADYLAAQVRLSYPTAAVAEMVKSGELPLTGAAVGVSDQVHAFLTEYQGKFEIGVQPVEQYVKRNRIEIAPETVTQVKRLQRVYQITPSDQAMTGLMKRGVDAAYHVLRYEKEAFVQTFAQDLGGPESAAQTYDKSVQVHNAVLNIAISYLTARTAPGIGMHALSLAQIVDPTPTAANAGDVIAYGTLETLFGEMDFCACDHCRSILSPAAYLVDLLLFIDQSVHPVGTENPQTVLLERRPDVQHLPLTCENTNTALPYIDVVNETLEYFIANNSQKLSLKDYKGHDTDSMASADLLASPQFVMDSAYTTLRGERFPAPLPFHQPLEHLRRYFDKFEVPLPLAMERLRKNNDLERGVNPYGWRDILMEEIGLSRAEYEILTDSNAVPLWRMYGFPNGTTDTVVITAISNAKLFTRRIGITYENIVSILKTRFVNPNSDLIPKLERLGVPFATFKALKDGTITDAAFDALLAKLAVPPDPAEYGGDIKAWVKNAANHARIMGLITLTDPTASPDSCSFDNLEFRYAKPMTAVGDTSTRISTVEFVRLLRFIRLWKKLGWTIEQTDAAICALFPLPPFPLGAEAIDTVAKLDAGFLTVLPRLGIIIRVINALNLTPKRDLLPLLACWSSLGTHGDSALYQKMFLNPALLKQDAVFADNGFGEFLPPPPKKLADHAEALRSAFNLTGDEYDRIIAALGYDANTPLTIPNISAIYRRGWLARKLKLSVRELLLLTQLTGLDPFAAPDPTDPAILRLISLVQDLKNRSIKSTAALYLIWNQDLSGKSAPDVAEIAALIRILRLSFSAIETEFSVQDDPDGTITQARIELVYGVDTAAFFFGLLNDTFATEVPYSRNQVPLVTRVACSRGQVATVSYVSYEHHQAILETSIQTTTPLIAYDNTLKRLTFTGVLSVATVTALKIAADTAITDISKRGPFKNAVDQLYEKNQQVIRGNLEQPISDIAPELVYDEPNNRLSFTGYLSATTANALKIAASTAITDTNARAAFKNAVDQLYEKNQRVINANLEQPIADAAPGRIAYDDFRKRLSYSGVLTTVTWNAIKSAAGAGAVEFNAAVDNLYNNNRAAIDPFFARYPELQAHHDTYVSDTTSSITEKRSNLLRAILPELIQRRKRQQALQLVSAMANTDLAFTQAFLDSASAPFPLHAVGNNNQSALNDLLALETSGLSVQFFASDTATGAIIPSPDIVSKLDYAPVVGGIGNPLPANQTTPGAAISGVWRGYIEVPENGFFNLRIEADANAKVTLLLDNRLVALTHNATLWVNANPMELRAETLYPITLTVEKVHNVVRMGWDWVPKGQGRAIIPTRYLYPAVSFTAFKEAYVRFLKAASLATGLGLTANEMAYFATHADYRINAQGQIDSNGQGWLSAVPNADNLHLSNPADAAVAKNLNAALLTPLRTLLDFARIKAEISSGDEALLAALKDPTTATQNADSLLFAITRWNQTSLNNVLGQFSRNIAGLGHFDLFCRVYDAFALIQKMGISAMALIQATTNEPTGDTVRNLQAALRARYDAADWRDVVQPINDAMRSLQRDALVAYILHQMRSKPATEHIDTADKLFEYFLMDVQMEPCMQTSRIRHALSSLQLFIERCLMNLEPRVSPASINAKQWEWMKRYRVWEANRKVFLYPENWLEPELRDDKSPFFKEIESELLQSDITEDSATTALLNYLSKLEEVAKLEPCGIYHVERNEELRTGEIDHVIARTAGANRKYYYRRYEYGYWTPWEQVKLDIEDNPVIPVVWKGRLLLFWLRILKQTPDAAMQMVPEAKLEDGMQISSVIPPEATQISVRVMLCWSEYYNGKWQPTKTSDVNRPATLDSFPPAGPSAFNRTQLILRSSEEGSGELQIHVGYSGVGWNYFKLYNTHSLPVPMRWEYSVLGGLEFRKLIETEIRRSFLPANPTDVVVGVITSILDRILTRTIMEINAGIRRSTLSEIHKEFAGPIIGAILSRLHGGLGQGVQGVIQPQLREILLRLLKPYLLKSRGLEFNNDALVAKYFDHSVTELPLLTHPILTNLIPDSVIEPSHPLNRPLVTPFFYEDSRHIFFVTTKEEQVWISIYTGATIEINPQIVVDAKLPDLVLKTDPHMEVGPKFWGDGGP